MLVSGAVGEGRETPIGWVLSRLDCETELGAGASPFEVERGGATFLVRVDRYDGVGPESSAELADESGQLLLFTPREVPAVVDGWRLPELIPPPAAPHHRVTRLSYSALALFERCSYRYYVERLGGLRERPRPAPVTGGLAATEIGDAVHRLLELVDLADPRPPDIAAVSGWYPTVSPEELERIGAFVDSYCGSDLAATIAGLEGAAAERPFAFEHDGVLVHGRLDVLHRAGGRALVVDYKTNALGERDPVQLVETDYRIQRLVYALACLRAGAEEVEVVYAFLQRADAVVSTTFSAAQIGELEAELSRPSPASTPASSCPLRASSPAPAAPALDVVCAGPALRGGGGWRPPGDASQGPTAALAPGLPAPS